MKEEFVGDLLVGDQSFQFKANFDGGEGVKTKIGELQEYGVNFICDKQLEGILTFLSSDNSSIPRVFLKTAMIESRWVLRVSICGITFDPAEGELDGFTDTSTGATVAAEDFGKVRRIRMSSVCCFMRRILMPLNAATSCWCSSKVKTCPTAVALSEPLPVKISKDA